MVRFLVHGVVVPAASEDGVAVFDQCGDLVAANEAARALLESAPSPQGSGDLARLLEICGAADLAALPPSELPAFFSTERCSDDAAGPVRLSLIHGERAFEGHLRAQRQVAERLEHSLTADFVAFREGTIAQSNAEFASMFGFADAAAAAGTNLLDRVIDVAQRDKLQRALQEGRIIRRQQVAMRTAAGRSVHVVVSLRWVPDGENDACWEGTIHDRSEEQRLQEQMLHSQRIEAVGRLAGGVAHDFNNLLTVILASAQLLEGSLAAGSEAQVHGAAIRAAAERAGELTRRLLAFGRRQVMRAEELDLNDLLRQIKRFVRSLLPDDVDLDVISGRSLALVHADRSMIEQVILNLVVNARDAMTDGGRLTIETENVVLNGAYAAAHPWASPGRYVLMTVSDTGCGMTPEVLAHAFEPFFTTKAPGKGSGLGLASAYGIVKQHDGLIHVYSEPGIGTTIKVYLPVAVRAASTVGANIQPKPPAGTETIILAEDEPAVRGVLVAILELRGYRVLPAENGEEAIRLLQKNADQVRLALVDVMMPGIGGVEAYHQLRQLAPELAIVFISGYTGEAVRSYLEADERLDFLPKPCDPDELLAKVKQAIEGKAPLA